MKISDGVEMLEISANIMGKPSVINPTLMWDKDNVILIDTGFPGQLPLFREAITKAGISFERLNKVIITHHDIDHVGSLLNIQKELSGNIKVLSHEEEKPYIQGEKSSVKVAKLEANMDSLTEEMKVVYQKLKEGFEQNIVEVDRVLTDGMELPYCGGITIIHTPGHTPGHICLYLKDKKILIAGDILMVKEGKLVSSPENINYDNNLNMNSLKKLIDYDIEAVICYHGGIFMDMVNQQIKELLNG